MTALSATRLAGRVAMVTGALRGIGIAIAERYLAEGAEVILADLKPDDDAEVAAIMHRLGQAASYVRLDVAVEADWQAAAATVKARFGRLDVLVNNAGVDCVGAVETIGMDAWRRIMGINISSIMGLVGYSETSAYNASKGAVRLFSKATAIEFAQKRMAIRVNSIHPGFVKTPLLDIGMQRWADEGLAPSAQALIEGLDAATPLGRIARPEEIAGAAYFLASDDSSYCTGSELVVDGGWTAQ